MTTSAGRIALATLGSVAVIGGLLGAKALVPEPAPEPEPSSNPATTATPTAKPTGPSPRPTASPSQSASPTPSPTPSPTASPSQSSPAQPGGQDGTYKGKAASTRYGPVQVEIDVSGGRMSDIRVIQYPTRDRQDVMINNYALPILIQESLAAQSANVDTVSGATYTSIGYKQSLQSAIDQAGI